MVDEKALEAAVRVWIDAEPGPDTQSERNAMRAAITTYLQALSPGSTGEPEGWRDIGGAPKDRPVLLTAPGGQIGVCVWGGRWLYYGLPNKPADWWDAPTHWRPLPAPPSAMLSAAGER